MTPFSFQKFIDFLNKYQSEFSKDVRVADYGGAYFSRDIRRALKSGGITDYHILDYHTKIDLNKPVKGKKFGLGICMDLLEHCNKPWLVAENITNSLLPGALLFVTAPFVWEVHDYPGDYFRYTTDGFKCLFDKLEYVEGAMARDLQLKTDKGGKSQVPDEALPRSRAIAVFRKPLKST